MTLVYVVERAQDDGPIAVEAVFSVREAAEQFARAHNDQAQQGEFYDVHAFSLKLGDGRGQRMEADMTNCSAGAMVGHRITEFLEAADLTVMRCTCGAVATLAAGHDWLTVLRTYLAIREPESLVPVWSGEVIDGD